MQVRKSRTATHPAGLFPWMDWRFSLILPVAILLLAVTVVVQSLTHQEMLRVHVTDQATGTGIADAAVQIGDETYRTDSDGDVHIERPSEPTPIRVSKDGYIAMTGTFGDDNSSNQSVALESVETAQGIVSDPLGKPVQGVLVRSGTEVTISRGDGSWSLSNPTGQISFAAMGFEPMTVSALANRQNIELQPVEIKAIYANKYSLQSEKFVDTYVDIAAKTSVNAVVLDVKDGTVFYDSEVDFFVNAGSVQPVYDPASVVAQLKDNGIYTIARIVVFKDPIVAEAYPELAVRNLHSGGSWRDQVGYAWVNPFKQELWKANIELAEEVLDLGFDEIQYDYVRFPSDGDLSAADFGQDFTAESRVDAITEFVKQSSVAIRAKGGVFGADLFGWITMNDTEQGIGQRFVELEPYLDVVNMMIYPTHYAVGNIWSAPGHPNDYPYETIYESLQRAEQNVPGSSSKFRPWLQAFDYPGFKTTTLESVMLQIQAAEDFGCHGWMLWGNPYSISLYDLAGDS